MTNTNLIHLQVDPGNLGALLRTAYFFGVDAVAIATRNCAPLGPVTLKASAGASESISLLSIDQPQRFAEESRNNGWKFFAAVAPNESSASGRNRQPYLSTSLLRHPSRTHPCVIMLGGEGEGLRANMLRKADFLVGVEGQRLGHGGLDSLNVSVAAGVLCDAFMKQPADSVLQGSAASAAQAHTVSIITDGFPISDPEEQIVKTIVNRDVNEEAEVLF